MDFLKELDALEGNCFSSGAGPVQLMPSKGQVEIEPLPSHPLPLLPADVRTSLVTPSSQDMRYPTSMAGTESLIPQASHPNRDHVDIREVPSEMPMYLLAEDEGNEEEILRLLEMESPGQSPQDHSSSGNAANEQSSASADLVTQQANPQSSRVQRHGGGWPKGRRRKHCHESELPKLPASGYSIFTAENRSTVEKECGTKSMSVLSRRLGELWSELTVDQKMVYTRHAQAEKLRYIESLKNFLVDSYKEMDYDRAQDYVAQSFSGECDDSILSCSLCQLKFTSLHNKQSHYSGKLHLQTLLQDLEKRVVQDRGGENENLDELPPNGHCFRSTVMSSLEVVGVHYQSCIEDIAALQCKINADLECHAGLQQQYVDAEHCRAKHIDCLSTLQTKEILMRKHMKNTLQIVKSLQITAHLS